MLIQPCAIVSLATTRTARLPALKILCIWSFAAGATPSMWESPATVRLILQRCVRMRKSYVQVTQEFRSEKTEKREYERLLEIRDNYPKYVLTTDEFAGGNYEGIKTMHVADFLLSTEY